MLVKAKGAVQAISASRLVDGVAVWLGPNGDWVERVDNAAVFPSADIPAAMERAREAERAQLVVDVYPLDVEVREGRTVPLHVRERMKAAGPSVLFDRGVTEGIACGKRASAA